MGRGLRCKGPWAGLPLAPAALRGDQNADQLSTKASSAIISTRVVACIHEPDEQVATPEDAPDLPCNQKTSPGRETPAFLLRFTMKLFHDRRASQARAKLRASVCRKAILK
jgi:hypothetical protein